VAKLRGVRVRAIAFVLLLACFTAGAAAQDVASVSNTTWQVNASWEAKPFTWVFDAAGRYKDSDGPTGSWTQNGTELTLNADAGFVYRCTLAGNYGSGIVYNAKDGSVAGSFWTERVNSPPGAN